MAGGMLAHDITMIAQLLLVHLAQWISLCLRTGLRKFESATVLFLVSLSIYLFAFNFDQSLCLTAITLLISGTMFTTHCSLL